MASVEETAKRLAEPFPAADIEWRVGSTNDRENPTKGIALAYITNRAVQQRLDDVVGIGNWRNEYQLWRNNGVLCGLSLRIEGEWITKWDGADESEMEAIKGGLSDAMKRAAYQWGIGRYLYNLPTIWTPVEKRGRTTVLKEDPKLPEWALPENERGKSKPPTTTQTQKPAEPVKPPQKPAEPKPEPLAETFVTLLLAEFFNRDSAKAWPVTEAILKPHGVPKLTRAMPMEEKKAALKQALYALNVTEANDLLGKLRELPEAPKHGG